MKLEKQIEAAARLNKWKPEIGKPDWKLLEYASNLECWRIPCWYQQSNYWSSIDNYLNDHNAIQSLVDGMMDYTFHIYANCLAKVIYPDMDPEDIDGLDYDHLLKATCPQKLEAILRAYEIWEEE